MNKLLQRVICEEDTVIDRSGEKKVAIFKHHYENLLKDSKRLQFLMGERCVIATTQIWEEYHYRLEWPFDGYIQRQWYTSAKEAVDAQMEEEDV
jgi:hypothetical protein